MLVIVGLELSLQPPQWGSVPIRARLVACSRKLCTVNRVLAYTELHCKWPVCEKPTRGCKTGIPGRVLEHTTVDMTRAFVSFKLADLAYDLPR